MGRTVSCAGLVVVVMLVGAAPASGMGKPRIAALQVGLRAHGVYPGTIDGHWGPATARGVTRLQRRAALTVDGVPGPATRRALERLGRPLPGRRLLRTGRVGWDVSVTQFRLAWHGFPSGALDGVYGPRTRAAVFRFQRHAGLRADGVVGPVTLAALRRPLTRFPISLRRPVRAAPGDPFGPRGNRFHTGLDYPAARGTVVRAAAGGRVVRAGWDSGGYGNVVVLGHGGRARTWYAHLSGVRVRPGRAISAGAPVGRVGATGHATGPHLHFEARVRGAAVDPLPALR